MDLPLLRLLQLLVTLLALDCGHRALCLAYPMYRFLPVGGALGLLVMRTLLHTYSQVPIALG